MSRVTLKQALATIPSQFREALIFEYEQSQRAALVGDWEKVGLKAGKICEISYCILEGYCTGTYPAAISKPKNMQDACRALENKAASTVARAAKIQMPRLIAAVYELRNNRAVGHAGGDVQPNQMDGLLFNQSIKWLIAEFVRLFHGVSLSEATKIVSELSVRWTTAIWEADGRKRVLVRGLDLQEQILTLLYFSEHRATLDELRDWLEVGNITHFKARQIEPLHKMGLIDFSIRTKVVHLLPPGAIEVEELLMRIGAA